MIPVIRRCSALALGLLIPVIRRSSALALGLLIPVIRRCSALALGLSLAAGATGCARDGGPELIKLRVATGQHLTMAPIFITQAEGYFEEQGLDVELVNMETPATALPALLQGRLDVLPGSITPAFFNAITRGARVRLVADKGAYSAEKCTHNALVVSARLLQRDPSAGTLRRVSTAKEPFLQFFVERALIERGFDPTKVELMNIPSAAEYEALIDGTLDAAMVGEPWLTRVRKTGGGVMWTPTNTFLDGYQYSVIAYGPRLLDEDPELGKRVAVALLKGIRTYNKGKTERNLEILGEALGHDPDELREVCWPTMREDGRIVPDGILDFEQWLLARGDLDAIVDAGEFWDPRFVEHALRVLDGED